MQLYVKPPTQEPAELTEKPPLGVLLKLAGNLPLGHWRLAGKPAGAWAETSQWESAWKDAAATRWEPAPLCFLHMLPTGVRREASTSELGKETPSFLSIPPTHFPHYNPRMIILKHNIIICLPKNPSMG